MTTLDNETLISLFLAWLSASGAAAGSLRTRRSHLHSLAVRVPLRTAIEADLVAALAAHRNLKPESRRGMLSTWRRFFGWAVARGYIDHDPTPGLAAIRVPSGMPRPIPETVLADVIASADAETRLMLLLGAYAGLRRAEIARVHADDIEGQWLRVRGKGDKVRRVPIHPKLAPALACLRGYAFPSIVRPGRPVTADYVSNRLGRVLPTPHTPHSLRHRFATVTYRGTHNLRGVSMLLGHAKPETTARYTLIDDEELVAAVASIAA